MMDRPPRPIAALPVPEKDPDELRAFLRVVYRALTMITSYLQKRYSL